MPSPANGGLPTSTQIQIASTILTLGMKDIGAINGQVNRYKAFTDQVTKANLQNAKVQTAQAALGLWQTAGNDENQGKYTGDQELGHLLDSCAGCKGKALKGLYPVPGIAKLKDGDHATIVAELLKHHFSTTQTKPETEGTVGSTPPSSPAKRKEEPPSSPAKRQEETPSGSAKRKADESYISPPATAKRVRNEDKEQAETDFMSDERLKMAKLWPTNIMWAGLIYSLSARQYIDLPTNEQELVDRLLRTNAAWVEEKCPSMALEINLPALRQSAIDAVTAKENSIHGRMISRLAESSSVEKCRPDDDDTEHNEHTLNDGAESDGLSDDEHDVLDRGDEEESGKDDQDDEAESSSVEKRRPDDDDTEHNDHTLNDGAESDGLSDDEHDVLDRGDEEESGKDNHDGEAEYEDDGQNSGDGEEYEYEYQDDEEDGYASPVAEWVDEDQ
ncbi:hypothetical protein PG988_004930 [Apiospora saccharicola]